MADCKKFFEHYYFALLILTGCLHFVSGDEHIPSVDEPFPGDHGPEPEPTTSAPYEGCPEVCVERLDEAMRIIHDLELKVLELNDTVLHKLNTIGHSSAPSDPVALNSRLTNVENHLYGNMTTLTSQLGEDILSTKESLEQQLTELHTDVDNRIAAIPAGGGGSDDGEAEALYANLTTRIDDLEFGKVGTLIEENNVWKKNFEVVNRTFAKLKKSKYSSEVVVVG